jgi:small-conductance mechanosensitive channel
MAAEQPVASEETPVVEEEAAPKIPTLGKIIPLAAELSLQLAVLRKDLAAGLDVSPVEKSLSVSEANLKDFQAQLEKLKASEERTTYQLVQFNNTLGHEIQILNDSGKPLDDEIERFGLERERWIQSKNSWIELQSIYSEDDYYDELKPTFDNAQITIVAALELLREHLSELLAVQHRSGLVLAGINRLTVEVDSMIVRVPVDDLTESSPPMFSSRFLTLLSSIEWYRLPDGMRDGFMLLPPFLESQGWILALQLILSVIIAIIILRNREQMKVSDHWKFIAQRPVSTGLLMGFLSTASFYTAVPPFMSFILFLLLGIAFARLLREIAEEPWKRHIIIGLIIFAAVYRFMLAANFPESLMRLFVVLAALVALFVCVRQSLKSRRRGDPLIYFRGLRLGALFFALIMILVIWGGRLALAGYILESSIRSFLVILGFWLFLKLIIRALEWIIDAPLVQNNIPVIARHRDDLVKWSSITIKVVVAIVLVTSILVVWQFFSTPTEAIIAILSFGFTRGEQKITLGLVILAGAIFYGSFVLSTAIDRLFSQKIFDQKLVDKGVQQSLTRLVHYALVFAGFIIAMSVLGFDFTKLTIIFGALSVGIGFGLQNIVNNFVSGLIMLFERPIRVGDVIEFGGIYAEVKNIGLRATWVRTFDNEEIVVPNSVLINSQVTNSTLTDRQIRRKISVGVAYGSDIPLVM